ncbi:MAG: hypothetical protein ABL916_16245 [Burkholderiaceae bacterium]
MSTTETTADTPVADEHDTDTEHSEALQPARPPSALDASFARGSQRPKVQGDHSVWMRDALALAPVSTDPGNVTSLDDYEYFNGHGLELAVDAMGVLHSTLTSIIEARAAVLADGSMPEHARALAVADVADSLSSRATKKADAALATLHKAIAFERNQLDQPVATAVSPAMAQELRSYVRGLKDTERLGFLMRCAREGDAETIASVVKAKAFLSGIDQATQASIGQQLNRVLNPDSTRKLAMYEKAAERLTHAGSVFVANMERAMGVPQQTVAKLRAQRGKTQKSLAVIGGRMPAV